jgi:hypothetical protein
LSVKTYLQEQIRLVSLSSYDLFTDEEYDLYMKIIECKSKLDELDKKGAKKEEKQPIIDEKNKIKGMLETLIQANGDNPRSVRLKSIIYYPRNADYPMPEGVTYYNLKTSKKIAEFCCELSRAMGLKHLDSTLDLIVIKWKNTEMLRQLVLNGFYMPLCTPSGVVNKHYRFFTASAGQLRRDKFLAISDDAWERIHERLDCGVGWDEVNAKGGINAN